MIINNGSGDWYISVNVFNLGGLWNGNLPRGVLLQAALCSLLCTGALGCSLELGHCIVCVPLLAARVDLLGRELSTGMAHRAGELTPRDTLQHREAIFLQLI